MRFVAIWFGRRSSGVTQATASIGYGPAMSMANRSQPMSDQVNCGLSQARFPYIEDHAYIRLRRLPVRHGQHDTGFFWLGRKNVAGLVYTTWRQAHRCACRGAWGANGKHNPSL
jgi:hypothetical protein